MVILNLQKNGGGGAKLLLAPPGSDTHERWENQNM